MHFAVCQAGRALQTMLSISTTLIKRHLQFAVAVAVAPDGNGNGNGQGRSELKLAIGIVSALAALLLLHLQLNARNGGVAGCHCRCSCSCRGSCISASASVDTQKRNLKFSWLPFSRPFLRFVSVIWLVGWLAGRAGWSTATHRDWLTDWLTAHGPRHTVRMSYAMTAWHRQQQQQQQPRQNEVNINFALQRRPLFTRRTCGVSARLWAFHIFK